MKKIHFSTIDSTNNYGKKCLSQSFEHGTMITADIQTGGRGRKGKSFASEGGLYMSILLKPTHPSYPITCAAAVAVQEAVFELCGTALSIKWVNDLFLDRKKVCGILTEAQTINGEISGFVCGIGVNTNKTILPEELSEIACTIPYAENAILAEKITEKLLYLYDNEINPIPAYRKHLLLNMPVDVYKNGVYQFSGTAIDINEAGNLIVSEKNILHTLQSGEISIKF